MVYLKIVAVIPSNKMIEFNQTKIQGQNEYQLLIELRDKVCLKRFQDSDIYNFFNGALVTLGEVKSITTATNKEAVA